jgi:peptidoglycan/xylan/chitin deacetylase (PgdA/CDA1 family)
VYASVEAFAADFTKLQDYLKEVTGVESTVYRFPGGSSNTVSSLDMEEYAKYLDSRNVRFFDWNVSSGDGDSQILSVEQLVKNSMKDIDTNRVSIILFHDSSEKKTTVEALPIIIENILAMEDTAILPITDDSVPIQHIRR